MVLGKGLWKSLVGAWLLGTASTILAYPAPVEGSTVILCLVAPGAGLPLQSYRIGWLRPLAVSFGWTGVVIFLLGGPTLYVLLTILLRFLAIRMSVARSVLIVFALHYGIAAAAISIDPGLSFIFCETSSVLERIEWTMPYRAVASIGLLAVVQILAMWFASKMATPPNLRGFEVLDGQQTSR